MSFPIEVVTIFPELFAPALAIGLVGKAEKAGRFVARTLNPRDFATDKHKKVDDEPYGGGAGLVMKPEPLVLAIEAAKARTPGPVVLLTPQGRPLEQRDLARWAKGTGLILVCGRYEGFDERIRAHADEQISLGDFVLTGGEAAALAIADGVVRLLPGTLGNDESPEDDSFSRGLLEFAQYTRPPEFRGARVPDILLSGHHAEVAAWRHADSIRRTHAARPELFLARGLSPAERAHVSPLGARLYLAVEPGAASRETPGTLEPVLAELAAAYRLGGAAVGLKPPEDALLVGVGEGKGPVIGPEAVRIALSEGPVALVVGGNPVLPRLPLRAAFSPRIQAILAVDRVLGEA